MATGSKHSSYDAGDIREYMGRRLSRLMTHRTDHEPLWKELREYIMPRAGSFGDRSGNVNRIPNYDSILNSTATNAVKVFTAFIMAGMSSPARPWFKLVAEQAGHVVTPDESSWLDNYRDLMLDVFARSNFYHTLPRVYEEGATFGNGCMYISADVEDVVRFYHYTIGEFYWGLSDRNEVNHIYRPFVMKVEQVVSKWGIDNVSDKVKESYNAGRLAEDVHIVHAIEPNAESLPKKLRPLDKRKQFVSIYYEQSSRDKQDKVLSVSGYMKFPAMPFRLHPRSDDPYGIGIGAEALGDIRELQHKEFELAKALDYTNEPHLKSSGGIGQIFRHPGAVTQVNPHNQDALEPVHQVAYPSNGIREEIGQLETRIREWFDNHLARSVLNETRSNVTAREIDAAEQEKLLLAGPVLESVQIFLSKIIDRTFEIMVSENIGEPPPESLSGRKLSVEFLGVLAQAQRAVGVRAIERTWQFAAYLKEIHEDPAVLDGLRANESLDDFARMVGMPSDNVASPEEREQKAANRQAEQQQMQQAAQAQQMAETGKMMAETPTGGTTALSEALDVVGAGF